MTQDVIFGWIQDEQHRQKNGINLIASENYVSQDILSTVGSVLMNKYVEGNVGARYYSGCEFIDKIEQEAIERFKKAFGAQHVNVQPHSGSQANMAVYFALLNPGDTILSMKLSDGGHLTHGHSVNMSGKLYNIVSYGVDPVTQLLDYDQLQEKARQHKPKLIIAGTSSYSREIDFARIAKIAQEVGAFFLADIAHIAGLVVTGLHNSPVGYADVITMTTHKTFRGPRGAVIMCSADLATKIDRAVMPGIQGGAFAHEIAAKAVACAAAIKPEFVTYQRQVIANAQVMVQQFQKHGYAIVSGGTDTHLFLVDMRPYNLTGRLVEEKLERYQIFVNRNAIPFDTLSPLQAGGIRIGTPAITTRGATGQDCRDIVDVMHDIIQKDLSEKDGSAVLVKVRDIAHRWS